MSELATLPSAAAISLFTTIPASKYSEADFDKMATAGAYLPRLTQFTDASALVKKREIKGGFYLVSGKDDRLSLGEDIEIVPVAWRFKALDTSAGKPISSTDPESDVFKSIAARANAPNSNCQAGIEYLVWAPAANKFGTYLMGNKTARREAAKIKPLIGCAVTIKTHTYENEQNIWQGPKVYESSVPVSNLPDASLLKETVDKFLNPPAEEAPEPVEEVKPSGKPARAR